MPGSRPSCEQAQAAVDYLSDEKFPVGIFTVTGYGWIASIISGLVIGLVFGAIFGAIGYAATRGRRDFTSASKIVAGRYDGMCAPARVEEARQLLARFSLRG